MSCAPIMCPGLSVLSIQVPLTYCGKNTLSNFRTKLPGSSNLPRSGILPDVEHVCVMGRIAAVVGDGVWISSEPDSNPLPPPDSESGKEKSE